MPHSVSLENEAGLPISQTNPLPVGKRSTVSTVITPVASAAALPVGGPATLLATSPPGALVVAGSGFEVALSMNTGAAQITPYLWRYAAWFPLGDAVNAPKKVSADSTGVSNGLGRFFALAGQTFAFVKSGAGTINFVSVADGEF